MKKYLLLPGTICALMLAGSAATAATVVDVGTLPSTATAPYFFITSGDPFGKNIHATFGATPTGPSTSFDYLFEFHVMYDGTGSGSLTTSFVGSPDTTVSQVIINNVSYTPSMIPGIGQSLNVGGVLLTGLALDTIEVIGTNNATGGPFAGTVAYLASSVPEPASWATFLLGFGFIGCAVRRRHSAAAKTA